MKVAEYMCFLNLLVLFFTEKQYVVFVCFLFFYV